MPCYSIITNRVDLGKASGALLDAALKSLGIEVRMGAFFHKGIRVAFVDGALESTLPASILATLRNQIAVAYSKQVLGKVAATTGWVPRQTGTNRYAMEKR